MKQVININYHGRIIPIEVTAIDLLKAYITSLEKHFSSELGKEEIINDIENRIAELFQERLNKGAVCITDEMVHAIITSVGRPEDFDSENQSEQESSSASESKTFNESEKPNKRFYRKEKNKIIGGVCAGLADYFGIDVVIVRVIFIVLFISFGFGLLPYLIIWVAAPSTASEELGSLKKKLYRDSENQMIGGVCSGLSHFFGIDVWVPRVLFLLPFIGLFFQWNWHGLLNFTPGTIIAYIICWLIIPEAKTTAEKLEMKGEKIDLNSIKKTIREELKGVQARVEEKGKEIKEAVEDKASGTQKTILHGFTQMIRSIVKVITFLLKGILLLLVGAIGLTIVIALLAIAFGAFAVLPISHFILNGFWENLSAVGVVLFFTITPAIALLTWLIRKIAGIRSKNRWLKISFVSLWILGWISLFSLASLLAKDFSKGSQVVSEEIHIGRPEAQKMELIFFKSHEFFPKNQTLGFADFLSYSDSALYLPQVYVRLKKADTNQFRCTMERKSNGNSRAQADELALQFQYQTYVKDSLLLLDEGIVIPQKSFFRNQRVTVTVYIPVGKAIRLTRPSNIHQQRNESEWLLSDWQTESGETVTFVMTEKGIVEQSNLPAPASKITPVSNPNQKQIDSLMEEKRKLESALQNLQQRTP